MVQQRNCNPRKIKPNKALCIETKRNYGLFELILRYPFYIVLAWHYVISSYMSSFKLQKGIMLRSIVDMFNAVSNVTLKEKSE